MLEFVDDSDLYFVQDKNNFINPLLQVGSGSVEKSTGSGGPKITGSGSSSLLVQQNLFVVLEPDRRRAEQVAGQHCSSTAGGERRCS